MALTVRASAAKSAVKAQVAQPSTRRAALLSTAGVLLVGLAGAAQARDAESAKAEKEARRAALRAAAGQAKSSGRDKEEVFAVPEYSVSEEARTPNVHSRQGEGARTSGGA